jgi:hypothetical protein
MRYWKRYWGDLLAAQGAQARREGHWGKSFRAATTLVRYRPRSLPRLFGPGDATMA